MKKQELKQIIKEEIHKMLNEDVKVISKEFGGTNDSEFLKTAWKQLKSNKMKKDDLKNESSKQAPNKALSKTDVSGSLPTEDQVLKTIFDCVFIRGIELEDYKWNFTNEQSGLYDALVKLFKGNDR